MDTSVFLDKEHQPSNMDLREKLGGLYDTWHHIREMAIAQYPDAQEDWNHSGARYGWNYRVRDRKRAILYLLPREGFFKVGMVFGQKAFDEILSAGISSSIKKALKDARPYAEGRGIRIDIRDESPLPDIEELIRIKLKY